MLCLYIILEVNNILYYIELIYYIRSYLNFIITLVLNYTNTLPTLINFEDPEVQECLYLQVTYKSLRTIFEK